MHPLKLSFGLKFKSDYVDVPIAWVDSVERLAEVHKQSTDKVSFIQSLRPRMKKIPKHEIETWSGSSNNQIG